MVAQETGSKGGSENILVGGPVYPPRPEKYMSSSIGMMKFPIYGENKKWQPNHQPDIGRMAPSAFSSDSGEIRM